MAPLVQRERLRQYVVREAHTHGALVRARRKSMGLTLAQVAELADSTSQTIHKVERGQIVAREDLRVALALALACEVADLFPIRKRADFAREVAS